MKQYEYISVYKSDETDFSHNGIRILCPTECKITEVLNGEYSLTLTHPFDDLGNWKFLIEYNIIKVQYLQKKYVNVLRRDKAAYC